MSLPPAQKAVKPGRAVDQAERTGKEFEAMMLTEMYEHMFSGVKTSGLTGGGEAEKTWRTFMLQEYARQTVESGGIGVAKSVADQIRAYQQGKTN
jgi:Rod binding domain-containing protein